MNQRRPFTRNVQAEQQTWQGRTARNNGIERQIRQTRQIQPGNTFWRVVRPGIQESGTS